MRPITERLLVACIGNANAPNTFGGLPYHMIEAGRAEGLIKGGLSFSISKRSLNWSRYLWNGCQLVRSGRFGGFQYSDLFLRTLWSTAIEPRDNSPILNVFQLFPEQEMSRNYSKYFYLDQTLLEVFDYYGSAATISQSWRENVLARERAQYEEAGRVIFRSRWAAERAKANYGLRDERVAVVLPGANIPQAALLAFDGKEYVDNAWSPDLKLIFVGKEWRRKGLDRLLGAMRLAKKDGARISLTVVGSKPDNELKELSKGLSVDWIGFFNKSSNPSGFIDLLANHNIGVLLSRSEAGGVSLREFGRAGLPVIAPDTGGSPEFAMSETAHLFAPDAPDSAIAEVLVALAGDRRGLDKLMRDAWARRRDFDWCKSVELLSCLL